MKWWERYKKSKKDDLLRKRQENLDWVKKDPEGVADYILFLENGWKTTEMECGSLF